MMHILSRQNEAGEDSEVSDLEDQTHVPSQNVLTLGTACREELRMYFFTCPSNAHIICRT